MNHRSNIKAMLNIPTGSRDRSINRNVATSGYSSLTDSQVFFGSQLWPETCQGASQDLSLSSRTSLHSSQEGSDSKVSSTYHTKPLLFGDVKDKGHGLLDKFEEDKKRAKEKNDSNILARDCQHLRETLNNVQQLAAGTERNTAMCQTLLDKFNSFAVTLQNNLTSLQSDISQQFETLLNKLNSQTEVMTELEERVQKSGDATSEFGSSLQSLRNSLESLREEQQRERHMLGEALKLLSSSVSQRSGRPSPDRVMDKAMHMTRTSPNILQPIRVEDTESACLSQNLGHNQAKEAKVPPQGSCCVTGKRKLTLRPLRRRKKRPLVPSQRSRHTVRDENTQPIVSFDKQQSVPAPLCERCDVIVVSSQESPVSPGCAEPLKREMRPQAAGSFITPLSCWSQDSESSACLAGIEPILEKLSAESRTGTPVRREGLWQLFDVDCGSFLGF